jgi:hypothetical protein
MFVLLVLWFDGVRGRELWNRLVAYCTVAAPVYAFFFLIDRVYQFYRFGSFTNTYVSIFAKEQRLADPMLPANFPWSTPFHEGFFGALFKPEKSIFLFDPLLVLAILLLVLLWRRLSSEIRAYGVTTLLLLFGYICFYARYTYWAGDFAWGDRYVSTAVELAALLAVPLLLHLRLLANGVPQGLKPESFAVAIGTAKAVPFPSLPFPSLTDEVMGSGAGAREQLVQPVLAKWIWRSGIALVAISLVIQVASLAFWLPLEIYQMETMGHPTFVIGLRFENIAAFALGKMQVWGLNNEAMTQDPWDYVHITTWNFLPFLLRRVGATPGWVVDAVFAVWGAAIAAMLFCLRKLFRMVEW